MKSDKIIEEILFEIEKHEGGMSRRNAMKFLAASPIAASVLASAATATEAHASSSNAMGKITSCQALFTVPSCLPLSPINRWLNGFARE